MINNETVHEKSPEHNDEWLIISFSIDVYI